MTRVVTCVTASSASLASPKSATYLIKSIVRTEARHLGACVHFVGHNMNKTIYK
jgi:hypothetical protein